ncbi:hypothetical protein RFI_23216 [Reticulomyxa filosa]|uniref:Uncharacterized protein n=1 Tax=Reticulomyxa filosa TaxID=46433 RepID=X6ML20_RETFI|nr:hypothetical protein RFI_23216 [Reticulomyxa filosa]|eukprot:ETO14152.1 hypothetical protein RFI_23216 [Reticulomyxa filosa]
MFILYLSNTCDYLFFVLINFGSLSSPTISLIESASILFFSRKLLIAFNKKVGYLFYFISFPVLLVIDRDVKRSAGKEYSENVKRTAEQEKKIVNEIVNGLNLDKEEIKEIEKEYIGNECTVTVYPGEESTRAQSFFQDEKVYDLLNEKDVEKQKEIIKEARRLAMSGKDATYTFHFFFF